MWEDSLDSSHEIVDKNPRKGRGQSASLYDFPTTQPKAASNIGKKKSSQNDIDALFSPSSASESNSPVEKPAKRTFSTYDILEPPKQEDLLGHLATSADFEDSILGELLGGGGGGPTKKPVLVDPPKPLEPPAASRPPASNPSKSKSSPPSRNAFRFATEPSPSSSANASPARVAFSPMADPVPSMASLGTGRPHTNSIDIDYINSSPELKAAISRNLGPAASRSNISRPSSSLLSSNEGLPSATQAASGSANAPPASIFKADDEVDMGGFMPSSMEPGRQGRRRRNIDSRPTSSSGVGGSSFDALDAALGLGIPSLSVGGSSQPINTTPAVATRKSFVDPFAKVESRIPVIAGKPKIAGLHSDSDSDRDDDDEDDNGMLRPLHRRGIGSIGKSSSQTSRVPGAEVRSNAPALPTPSSSSAAQTSAAAPTAAAVAAPPSPLPPHPPSSGHLGGKALGSSLSDLPSLRPEAPPLHPPASEYALGRNESSEDELDVSGIVRREEDYYVLPLGGRPARQTVPNASSAVDTASHAPSSTLAPIQPPTSATASSATSAPSGVSSGTRGVQLSMKTVGQTRSPPKVSQSLSSPISHHVPSAHLAASLDESFNTEHAPPHRREAGTVAAKAVPPTAASNSHSTVTASVAAGTSGSGVDNEAPVVAAAVSVPGGLAPAPVPSHRPGTATTSTAPSASSSRPVQDLVEQTRKQVHSQQQALSSDLQALQAQLLATAPQVTANSAGGVVTVPTDTFLELRSLQEQNHRYLHELLAARQTIVSLEAELSRTRDDVLILKSRHVDEKKDWEAKLNQELKEAHYKHENAMQALQVRHKEALQAMEHVHRQELSVYEDKLKNMDVMDRISQQIYQTSDAMKVLESELQVRHRYIEQMKVGQVEARERLLEQREQQIQQSSQQQEMEIAKLQGLLQYMESMMASVRAQQVEEKTRWQQEHNRLSAYQAVLTQEKDSLHEAMARERSSYEEKLKDIENCRAVWLQEKKSEMEHLMQVQRQVEHDKREWDIQQAHQRRILEQKEKVIMEDERRMSRQREEWQHEQQSWEERRAQTRMEIEVAEKTLAQMQFQQSQWQREHEQVLRVQHQVQQREQDLEHRERDLQDQRKALDEREHVLRESFAELKLAAQALQEREQQVRHQTLCLEQKADEVSKLEATMEERRLMQAKAFREHLQREERGGGGGGLLITAGDTAVAGAPSSSHPTAPPHVERWSQSPHTLSTPSSLPSQEGGRGGGGGVSGWSPAGGVSVRGPTVLSFGSPVQGLPHEVKLAQRALRDHRQALAQLTVSSLNTRRVLSFGGYRSRQGDYVSSSVEGSSVSTNGSVGTVG